MAPGAVERCPDCDGQHFDWSEHDNAPVCTECGSLCPEVTLSLTNSSTDILDAFKKSAKDACSSDGHNMLSADEPLRDKFSKFVSENYRRNTVNYRELWPCIDELARRLQPTLSIGDDLLSSMRRDLLKQSRTTIFNWKVRTDKKTLAYAWFYKQLLDHGIEVRDDLLPDFPSRSVRLARLKLEKRIRRIPTTSAQRSVKKNGTIRKPKGLSHVNDSLFGTK